MKTIQLTIVPVKGKVNFVPVEVDDEMYKALSPYTLVLNKKDHSTDLLSEVGDVVITSYYPVFREVSYSGILKDAYSYLQSHRT